MPAPGATGRSATRLDQAMLEGCWLAALVVVPPLFHVHSETIFEPDKAAVLRSLGLLIGALGVAGILRRRRSAAEGIRTLLRAPVAVAAGLTLGAYLLATAVSIDPGLSFWGTYDRRQGLLTALSYLAVFGAVFALLRTEGGLRRILQAMVLAAAPAALYATCQAAGLDPLGWWGSVRTRPTAQAGNPIFLAAHLLMAIPPTLVLGLDALTAPGRGARGPWVAAGYGGLALVQGGVLLATGSRGPLLGLLAGVAFFALVALRWAPRSLAVGGLASLLAAVGLGALLVLPGGPMEELRSSAPLRNTVVGRLGRSLELERGSVAVRLRIWEGIVDLLGEDPARLAAGYGPETVTLTHHRHYDPELTSLERREMAADRAHNRTLEIVATRGAPGLLADLALFGTLIYTVLAGAGVIAHAGRWRWLAASVGAGAAAGVGGALLLETPVLLAALPLLGGVAGLLAFLAVDLALRVRGGAAKPPGGDREGDASRASPALLRLALAAMGAVAVGHLVETQIGIETVAAGLHLWVAAGVTAALGARTPTAEGPEAGGGAAWGVVLGLGLGAVTFAFAGVDEPAAALLPVVAASAGAALLAGLLPLTRRGAGPALAAALGVFALLLGAQLAWPSWSNLSAPDGSLTTGALLGRVEGVASALPAFTASVILAVGLFALVRAGRWSGAGPAGLAVSALCVVVAAPAAWALPLRPVRADVYAHAAGSFEARADWATAARLYDEASRRLPGEPRYAAFLARAELADARDARRDPWRRRRGLEEALRAATRARDLRPRDPRYSIVLGRIEAEYGLMLPPGREREEHFERADRAFRDATRAAPLRASVWTTWGRSLLERGRPREALQPLRRARALDPGSPAPRVHLGEAYLATGSWADARDAYRSAVELEPGNASSWRGLGSALAQLDARAEAVRAYRQAVARGADDVLTYRNMALMMGELGRITEAIAYGERALRVAPSSVEDDVRDLLEQLREISGTPR